jgi:large subunit ribosomal protein L5
MESSSSTGDLPVAHARYASNVVRELQEKFGIKNPVQIPKFKKIVLNMGIGDAVGNSKAIQVGEYVLSRISGQKPVVTRSRKSIATFKLREGAPIGCMVTLRGARMYDFFERLVAVALPRVKDFRGISRKGFDRRGNFNMGIVDATVFPEVDIERVVDKQRGFDISIVTTASSDNEAMSLLELMGMPFRK